MHAVCKLLAGGEAENDGQARHVAIDVAATAPEYVFAPQSVHVADPVDALYFPVAQFAHVPPSGPVHPALQMQLDKVELATGELEFVGQVLHVVLVVAPDAIEYVPAPQSEHVAAPVDVLYFPATHRLHGPPSGPVDPALQVQLAKVPLPASELEFDGQVVHVVLVVAPDAVEYLPAPQSKHTVDPANALYLPATHAVQVPPFEPEYPTLQVQLVSKVDPAGEFEFVGQFEQSAAPVAGLYVPALHRVQMDPSEPVQPVLHVQAASAVLPSANVELPSGQVVQVALPIETLYDPIAH
jgi:hypothetical protein